MGVRQVEGVCLLGDHLHALASTGYDLICIPILPLRRIVVQSSNLSTLVLEEVITVEQKY